MGNSFVASCYTFCFIFHLSEDVLKICEYLVLDVKKLGPFLQVKSS